MQYDLALMARRRGLKRRETILAPIIATRAQASALARILRAILAPWLGVGPAIERIYARELQRQLQTDSVDDLSDLFGQLGDEVDRLILDLTPALRDWAIRLERWHRDKWARSVLAGAGIDISTMIGPADAAETIETVLARNTALIRRVSDEARGKVADAVFRGLQQRTPSRIVAREIMASIGSSRARANRIASDQANKLASALDRQRQREAGLTVWKWRHSGKLHPREWHKDRDGNLYADDKADRGKAPNGEPIRTPPAEDDLPGIPPFCGCVRQGVLILPE